MVEPFLYSIKFYSCEFNAFALSQVGGHTVRWLAPWLCCFKSDLTHCRPQVCLCRGTPHSFHLYSTQGCYFSGLFFVLTDMVALDAMQIQRQTGFWGRTAKSVSDDTPTLQVLKRVPFFRRLSAKTHHSPSSLTRIEPFSSSNDLTLYSAHGTYHSHWDCIRSKWSSILESTAFQHTSTSSCHSKSLSQYLARPREQPGTTQRRVVRVLEYCCEYFKLIHDILQEVLEFIQSSCAGQVLYLRGRSISHWYNSKRMLVTLIDGLNRNLVRRSDCDK